VPGNVLIEKGYLTLRQLMTRRQCIERCLNEASFTCLSAVFRLSQKNIHTRQEDRMLYGEKSEMGMCILSREDKTTQASSYRVADTDVEYIENQCVERCEWRIH
jgi:PAN domain